jgi:hypothetical protein
LEAKFNIMNAPTSILRDNQTVIGEKVKRKPACVPNTHTLHAVYKRHPPIYGHARLNQARYGPAADDP